MGFQDYVNQASCVSSRIALFSTDKHDQQDSEKLLDLYKNRAELKKAFADAQDDQYRLKKLVSERDGDIARLEQKLAQIEDLLVDPEWVHTVAVHYQLRALNQLCANRIARFAEQLKQQREKRQHEAVLQTWNAERSGRATGVKSAIGKIRSTMHQLEERQHQAESEVENVNVFARLFRRRKFSQELATIAEETERLRQDEEALLSKLDELQHVAPPEQPGLDIAAKRSINFMILSYAQQIYIQFEDDNLVSLVKEAGDKSVGAVKYGDKDESDRILEDVGKRWHAFDKIMDHADAIQERARLLSKDAMFMDEQDAVPVAGTVSMLICINDGGGVTNRNANLVGEDYWSINKVFSR